MRKWLNGEIVEMTEEEIAEMSTHNTFEILADIDILKQNLVDTDYVIIKIAEGVATKEDYADIIAQRQVWRTRINELQAQLEVTEKKGEVK